MADKIMTELRQEVAQLSACLPKSIDLLAVSTYKAPGKVLMLRESLIWRGEELARNALAQLEASNFVTAALLTRAMMETTGAIVYLHGLMQKAIATGFTGSLDDRLNGFLTGSKVWEDIGGAIHVNDMLREVEKFIPKFFSEHYAMLSEFAHPNWSGTFGAFGITAEKELRVDFARGGRSPETKRRLIAGRLAGSVGLFAHYCNVVGDLIPSFTKAVETFHASEST